jgi:hypothetical protein
VGGFQGLVEVGDDVVGVLDADGDPDQLRLHPGLELLGGRELGMGRGGRVDDERADVHL